VKKSREIDIRRRTLGVVIDEHGDAAVNVWAPFAKSVCIIVNDQQTINLTKNDRGYWQAASLQLKPNDQYKFVIDAERKLPDPVSLSQPNGVHGASAVVDIKDFYWSDNSWQNIPLAEYIIYELHIGTVTPAGDFAAVQEKLEYLKSLGITAIEIMPVAQFPGDRNWGYDGVFPFAVQNSYGGAKGLQQLVDACHQKGIAVVLDVVYNHLGPEGNYLSAFGAYFTEKYKTPWGGAINFDDAYSDEVRRYFIENALMWFRDFHVDALRLDAVHAIRDLSAVHILKEIKQYVNKLSEETKRSYYLIVESDLNDPKYINEFGTGGYGMDAQWVDEFHHALRVASGGEHTGYYTDFKGVSDVAKAYRDAYVYNGQYSEHRKKTFGEVTRNPGQSFVVFSQNHDQVGNRMLGERTSQLVSFEMQKLLAAAVMISPFLPMLFMGEEWSETNPFLYFISHSDEVLVAAVRKGRSEEFAAFHSGEAPDPASVETFLQSKLQWHLLQHEPHKTMQRYYQQLILIRKQLAALRHLNRNKLQVHSYVENNTLALHRWYESEHVLCLMNFSSVDQRIAVKNTTKWAPVFRSSDVQWLGPGASGSPVIEESLSSTFFVSQQSILILQRTESSPA
jgi:maltooligosyltrehalose trehalohydrolase